MNYEETPTNSNDQVIDLSPNLKLDEEWKEPQVSSVADLVNTEEKDHYKVELLTQEEQSILKDAFEEKAPDWAKQVIESDSKNTIKLDPLVAVSKHLSQIQGKTINCDDPATFEELRDCYDGPTKVAEETEPLWVTLSKPLQPPKTMGIEPMSPQTQAILKEAFKDVPMKGWKDVDASQMKGTSPYTPRMAQLMTGITVFKLNNFNDVSWWNIKLSIGKKMITPELHTPTWIITKTWGHRLPDSRLAPIVESGNIISETFEDSDAAIKSALSDVEYQVNRKGYSYSIPTAPPSLPMLCHEYHELPKWQSYAMQPKLDGIRCIMSREGLLSRTNTVFTSCPHLELYTQMIPPGIKLDGELYVDGLPMHMIESIVMRNTPARDTYKEVCFNVFDIIDTEAPFSARIEEVIRIIDSLEDKYLKYRMQPELAGAFMSMKFPFRVVQTVLVEEPPTDHMIQDYFQECIGLGYEGCIIRNLEAPYEPNKRSKHILKLKEFFDNEFEIIDVIEGKGGVAVFVCDSRGGGEFRCSFKATQERRRQLFKMRETLIGKWLRVEHEGLFDNGKPRCPVGIHYFDKKDHD